VQVFISLFMHISLSLSIHDVTQMCLATDLCLLLVAQLGSSCDFHRTLQSS
jgi:hypothetical protein